MKGVLVIFAKDARFSEVKTRLAKQTNQKFASIFNQQSLKATFEMAKLVKKQSKVSIDLLCAMPNYDSTTQNKWQKSIITPVWTASNDLAKSLDYLYQKCILHYDFVVFIGSDTPQIMVSEMTAIINKISQLKAKDCIIGPSMDGGFYLFAAKDKIDSKLWLKIHYSENSTLEQFVKQLEKNQFRVKKIKKKTDIDNLESLEILKNELETRKNLSQAQKKLLKWLNEVFKKNKIISNYFQESQ